MNSQYSSVFSLKTAVISSYGVSEMHNASQSPRYNLALDQSLESHLGGVMRKVHLVSSNYNWVEACRKYLEAGMISVSVSRDDPDIDDRDDVGPNTSLIILDAQDLSVEAAEIISQDLSQVAPVLVVFSTPRSNEQADHDAVLNIRNKLHAAGASGVLFHEGHEVQFMARVRSLLIKRFVPRVLIIEDDEYWAKWITNVLSREPYELHQVDSLAAAFEAFKAGPLDAVIVDRLLPDGDGLTFVKKLRAHFIVTPALIFSVLSKAHDEVEGYGAGADQYMTKPIDPDLLRARVEIALRPNMLSETLIFGPFRIQVRDELVWWRHQLVRLSPSEFQLLHFLAEKAGLQIPLEVIVEDLYDKYHSPVDDAAGIGPEKPAVLNTAHKQKGHLLSSLKKHGIPDCIKSANGKMMFDPSVFLDLESKDE